MPFFTPFCPSKELEANCFRNDLSRSSKNILIIIIIIPRNHEVKELQKTTILGNAHILQKVLLYKYIRANAGAGDTSAINSSDRIAATFCSLSAWFVSGMCV
jgi:hypothetical protein